MIDVTKLSYGGTFKPINPVLVFDKGRTYLIAFEGEFNNRKFYNIREIYEQYGEYFPGKNGISIPFEQKELFLRHLVTFALMEMNG